MNAANKLGIKKRNILASISGICGVQVATIQKAVEVSIRSHFPSKFEVTVEANVLQTLTTYLANKNLT